MKDNYPLLDKDNIPSNELLLFIKEYKDRISFTIGMKVSSRAVLNRIQWLTSKQSLNISPSPTIRILKDPLILKYTNYRKRIEAKGKELTITFEQFTFLLSQACHYCNAPARSIDRLNSEIGYTPDNSVPCCTQCNLMKNIYTEQSFLSKIEEIYKYRIAG